MNYAQAFAQALNEDMDARGIKKSGPNGVGRVDASQVVSVRFEGDEAGGYSEYTQWDDQADLQFFGPEEDYEVEGLRKGDTYMSRRYTYCHIISMHELGTFDIGKVMERAVEIIQEEK